MGALSPGGFVTASAYPHDMSKKACPHCGETEAAEIVYGLPGHELMASATRGDVLLGGCCIRGDDPTHGCLSCGSEWATSKDHSRSAISRVFAAYFANWDIELPPGAETAMGPGLIRKAGWSIRYRFDVEDAKYLEFYAIHRMTDDRRLRIYASGRTEHLNTIQQMLIWDPKVGSSEAEAKHRYDERNRRVAFELRSLGLYPDDDINTYLRTHDVPRK